MDIVNPTHSRPTARNCSRANGIITQVQLAEMFKLRKQARREKALRRKLIAMLDAGAEVEPGPLTAWIDLQRQQRLTLDELVKLVGPEQVATWKRQVEPAVYRVLKIEDHES